MVGTAASQLKVLKKTSLRESVANALRAAIISGELLPGNLYSAPSLSERFGVSATPVREAMLDLTNEGLVVAAPNKGFRITEVSEEDLDAITSIRMLLEPPTVRQVTELIPDADFPMLRALAQDIVDSAARGDLVNYTDADRVFHLRLIEYTGNSHLVKIVSDLRARTRLLGLAPLSQSGQLDASALEHLELVELLEARDGAAAEEFMRRHIGKVRGLWADPAKSAS